MRYWKIPVSSLLILLFVSPAMAYIGPGAGFAVVSSFLILFVTAIVAFLTILIWPFRAIWLRIKRGKFKKRRQVKRVVVVGLDGLDPALTHKFMRAGKLPNFRRLKEEGSFRPLQTTYPSISPVAWSTYATGVNPGKHRIFDFFTRNPKNYLPVLSSSEVSVYTKTFRLGPIKIPVKRTSVNFLRKSTSFWKILGQNGIFCSVLRVPITFPPEKFYGTCLSAMCTPDLRGTQGSFTLFTSAHNGNGSAKTGGTIVTFQLQGNHFKTRIPGPAVTDKGQNRTLSLPLQGTVNFANKTVTLKLNSENLVLAEGEYSPWLQLDFTAGLRKRISGIARFLVTEMESPHVSIYMTPINIDPKKPALPVSHPLYFSIGLSKLHGSFSTLGLAEDTWALNEGVISESAFLEQAYDIYEERKKHLFDSLKKNSDGFVTCVFDTTDRIQHMFFRYLDDEHPANKGKNMVEHKRAIEDLYVKMDGLIGEVQKEIGPDDVLMVVSDHGFRTFKWGINLNSWLWKEGYLVLKDGADLDAEWLMNVDWSKTRAFAYALAGIFLNVKGRERDGIVQPGAERTQLQREIQAKLEALIDEQAGKKPIRRCLLSQQVLNGPYIDDCPDLLVGYHIGYRASWNSAVGRITHEVIETNTKQWSGDHGIDPQLVPGVFFSNWKLADKKPSLQDIAPTILTLFGVGRQRFQDGKALELTIE